MPRKLTTEINLTLSQPFTETEVKEALFSMNPLGSPGPDGFPAFFYQEHWPIVGVRVTQAVLGVLNGGSWTNALNETHIALIPKKTFPLSSD